MAVTVETGTGRPIRVAALLGAALVLASCGGSASHTTTVTTSTTRTVAKSASPAMGELLSVPAVGRIYGRCKPGESPWPVRYVNDTRVTDAVTYQLGGGHPRTVSLNPGQTLTLRLVPGQARSRQPADPKGRVPAQTIRTTVPVVVSIDQGSEIHIYRAKVTFVLAAAIGDTANCALVSSSVRAFTYYPGGQPAG